jgi:hypothetical protein
MNAKKLADMSSAEFSEHLETMRFDPDKTAGEGRYASDRQRAARKMRDKEKKRRKEEAKLKRSKSGKTVKTPAGTAVTTTKKGQKKTASRKRVKAAGKNVLKSGAKRLVKRAGPVGAAVGIALDLAEGRGAENFKNIEELERGKMSKGLRKVKPLPADKRRKKTRVF